MITMEKLKLRVRGEYFATILVDKENEVKERAELLLNNFVSRIHKLILIDYNGNHLELDLDYFTYEVDEPNEEDN